MWAMLLAFNHALLDAVIDFNLKTAAGFAVEVRWHDIHRPNPPISLPGKLTGQSGGLKS